MSINKHTSNSMYVHVCMNYKQSWTQVTMTAFPSVDRASLLRLLRMIKMIITTHFSQIKVNHILVTMNPFNAYNPLGRSFIWTFFKRDGKTVFCL